MAAINQEGHASTLVWSGLSVVVRSAVTPRPPPTWPTIMIDVGTEFPFAKDRLLVRLMVNPPVAPVGTVITTGDQVAGVAGVVAVAAVPADAGFSAAQVAVDPVTAEPQK